MLLRPLCLTSALAIATAMPASAEMVFNRISIFATPENTAEGVDRGPESSAEILSASDDGTTLVYTDSPLGAIGLVDITDPHQPKPLGTIDMGGEPTTAHFVGDKIVVGVNTSDSYIAPSGKLVILDAKSRKIEAECDIGGQPDSVARSADGSFVAIAVENERDEDLNDGALPQAPAGYVVKIALQNGTADCAGMQKIDVTGLADVAGDDPEPEFVDINDLGEIVLTLQENNHIVVIGADGKIASHFNAGSVELTGIDTKSDGKLAFTDTKDGVAREPDGVKWINADHFAIANEGDWKGGSRSFSIFHKDGSLVYEAGSSLERAIVAIGHYPEHRSKSKGVELESVEAGTFNGTPMLFVGSERASVIGVYDVTDPAAPVLRQLLPSGVSPEGMVAIPQRNLFATANEVDLRADGLGPAHVMVYEFTEGTATYPMLTSAGSDALIGWGALSGLTADPDVAGRLYAVSDSVYAAQPRIFTIDATQKPARITAELTIKRGGDTAQMLDLEGIAADGDGGFWLASEGRSDRMIPHAIYHVNRDGDIEQEIALPQALLDAETRFGFEGITVAGDWLWLAVQREWRDDPEGFVKLVAYNTKEKTWGAVHYPLDVASKGTWIGLSEITLHGDWAYIVERDNQIAENARVKKLYRVAAADLVPAEIGGDLPVMRKELVRDLLPDLGALNGYAVDKIEGFAIDAAGTGFVVTDNDGVDDSSGETLFWSIGTVQ